MRTPEKERGMRMDEALFQVAEREELIAAQETRLELIENIMNSVR